MIVKAQGVKNKIFDFTTILVKLRPLTSNTWVWLGLVLILAGWAQVASQLSRYWVDHTFRVLRTCGSLSQAVQGAQSEFLNYKNEGSKDGAIAAYRVQMNSALDWNDRLGALTIDNPDQQVKIEQLKRLLKSSQSYPNVGFAELYRLISTIQIQEQGLLDKRKTWADLQGTVALIGVAIATGVTIIIKINTTKERKRLAKSETELEDQLQTAKLEKQFSGFLSSCRRLEESYPILKGFLEHVVPGCKGAIYTTNPSGNQMRPVVTFGDFEPVPCCAPSECWAIRTGEAQTGLGEAFVNPCQLCQTMHQDSEGLACLQLTAYERVIGIIHLVGVDAEDRRAIVQFAHDATGPLATLRLWEELQYMGFHDSLTGMRNRRYLDERLPEIFTAASREGENIGVLFIDIDHFKQVNDAAGHAAGDLVLQGIAQCLKTNVRAGHDIAARISGDELVVILVNTTKDEAIARAEELRAAVSALRFTVGSTVTCSIGVASYPIDGKNQDEILAKADVALYRAKSKGRNCVEAI